MTNKQIAKARGLDFKRLGLNRKMFTDADGTIIFVSYSTPVAVKTTDGRYLVTSRKYSVSTSKHCNQFVRDALPITGSERVDQSVIDQYAAGVPAWL